MKRLTFKPVVKKILADTVTPVSIYLRLRTLYPQAVLLESSDYHGHENAYSFVCFQPVAFFTVTGGEVTRELPGRETEQFRLSKKRKLYEELDQFFNMFDVVPDEIKVPANGLFGYMNYDAVRHFENIQISAEKHTDYSIPEVKYCCYKYVIAIDHHKNQIHMV
ncbi:MAG: anthranilate synthase component I family protein, partial [Mariniphaga sp.]|nr:anthranilate synthase component I family protein [Mariniphaga sp.]